MAYLTGAQQGQPLLVHHWIGFWIDVVKIDPTALAYLVAIGETAVAVALILGAFTNPASLIGVALSLVIWSTAEGFGGPYQVGSTNIGAAIISVLVFASLFLGSAGLYLGLDRRLTGALGRLGFLAAAPIASRHHSRTTRRRCHLAHAQESGTLRSRQAPGCPAVA